MLYRKSRSPLPAPLPPDELSLQDDFSQSLVPMLFLILP
jgi:hypothetical protein